MQLVPYLNFPGNTREAMTYYRDVFGGELIVHSFADFHTEGMPPEGTMHASLTNGGLTIMASDAMPGAEDTWGGTRVYLSVAGAEQDAERLQGAFDRLADDGEVGMAMEPQVWGDVFGIVKDRYGIEWMITIARPSQG